MSKNGNIPLWSQIRYLMSALIFALLAILSTRLFHLGIRHYFFSVQFGLRWLFWFFIAVSGICLLPIIHAFLSALHERGILPRFIDVLYRERFKSSVVGTLFWVRTAASKLEGQLVLLTMSILILVMLLPNVGAIDDDRVDGSVYEFISSLTNRRGTNLAESIVVEFTLPVGDCDSAMYLRRYSETMSKLKEAGAKAVLIDTRSLKGDALTLMQELKGFDFIVYGLGYVSRVGIILPYAKTREYSKGIYSIESDETMQMRSIGQPGPSEVKQIIYLDKIPAASLPFGTEELHDIALELLRKYLGSQSELKLNTRDNLMLFDDYRIPVTKGGWVYSRVNRNMRGWGFASNAKYLINESGISFKKEGMSDYEKVSLHRQLAGKIIFVRESGQNLFGYSTGERLRYGHILTNLVEKDFFRKAESGHIWFTVVCLVLSALMAYRLRPLVAFLLTFAVGVCTILLGAYLYDSQHLIIDIFYPLLATTIAMVVFPIIAMGHGFRSTREQSVVPEQVLVSAVHSVNP